jgi:hypothetical protein
MRASIRFVSSTRNARVRTGQGTKDVDRCNSMGLWIPRIRSPSRHPLFAVPFYGMQMSCTDRPLHLTNGIKLSFVNDIIFKLTVLFTKLSLCLIYAGLFKSVDSLTGRVSRFINSATACIVICYYTVAFFLSIFRCSPISKAWISSEPGECINNTALLYSTGCVNIITSLLVIGIPLPVLMQTTSAKNDIAQLLFLVLLGLG